VTLRCNLRCSFCGQWGDNGYARKKRIRPEDEFSPNEWIRAIDQIMKLTPGIGNKPGFVVWGGEPLLYKGLDKVLSYIHKNGCRIGLVSNGVLLEDSTDVVKDHVSTLYVSLDGPGSMHDKIRGVEGIHTKIERGMSALAGSKVKKVCLSTINAENWNVMGETAIYAQSMGFDKIVFQNLIFLLPPERDAYDAWLREGFGINDSNSRSWTFEGIPEFAYRLPEALSSMKKRVDNKEFNMPVEFQPFGLGSHNIIDWMEGRGNILEGSPPCCLAPSCHFTVSPEGLVRFCIDFSDMPLGSLRDNSVLDILQSEKAVRFREDVVAGKNPACIRCSWRHNKTYDID